MEDAQSDSSALNGLTLDSPTVLSVECLAQLVDRGLWSSAVILGGLIVEVGDRRMDLSLRTQIRKFQETLASSAPAKAPLPPGVAAALNTPVGSLWKGIM